MDPSTTLLGKMILEEITPLVMVLRTPLVEETCLKNGLNFIQILRQFCFLDSIDVPVRTASDPPYRLQKFKLRLAYAVDICHQNAEVADRHLEQVVRHANESFLPDLPSEPPPLEDLLHLAEARSLPAWLQMFNEELIRTLSFSEHETFDHPVACLLAVSSRDVQPVNKFVDFFNTDQMPSLLSEGAMDPKVLKYYLLVHDNQEASSDMASGILVEMRSTFGSNSSRLLCINSGGASKVENVGHSTAVDVDCYLNEDDLSEIKVLMQDLASEHIIPYMEQKIRVLNQQVSATRRGFRNQIKNLWWRKGKDDNADALDGPVYTFSSSESQIRMLGDFAFMLRDYELALSNYRMLSTDFKLDKAWKRYAGVQEMIGLCYFMLDQSRKDAESCMETAFYTYIRTGPSCQRNATRCGLWWGEMLKSWFQYKDAAGVYYRVSVEEPPIRAAVLLEQSSYCYLCLQPPMLRKFGFHLILAGSNYDRASQTNLAIQAYINALSIYKQCEWSFICDHIHFNLGKWYSLLGQADMAVGHMVEILACSHQPLFMQESLLKNFSRVVLNSGAMYVGVKLHLPVINVHSLDVIFEDHRTYASTSAIDIEEKLWRSLEAEMVAPTLETPNVWLECEAKYSLKQNNDVCISLAGEAIKVILEFSNPLQIPVSVTRVSLICDLSPIFEATWSGNLYCPALKSGKSVAECLDIVELIRRDTSDIDDSTFTLSEQDFSLSGGETLAVELCVTPNMEGFLKIVGVRWTLSDFVVGYSKFRYDQLKSKAMRGKTKCSSRRNLNFIVIKNLPRLEGSVLQIPEKVYSGDLRRLILELKNQSSSSVKNLMMKASHPELVLLGSQKELDANFRTYLQRQIEDENVDSQLSYTTELTRPVTSFPEGTTIQGGETLLWPLWLHADVPDSISLCISLYYEMANDSDKINYRFLRMNYKLEVLPSLDASFRVTPCLMGFQEFFVHMEVLNKSISESISLHQLLIFGGQWEILPLLPYYCICSSKLLQAGQKLSGVFKLKGCEKPSDKEKFLIPVFKFEQSDAYVGSQDEEDALPDLSCLPLMDLYKQAKLHSKSNQGQRTVDLVLVSMSKSGSASSGTSHQLLQPFSCHFYFHSVIMCPIQWLVEGPGYVLHDFCTSFCDIKLHVAVHNYSDVTASVRINTFDVLSDELEKVSSELASSDGEAASWCNTSIGTLNSKVSLFTSISPIIWGTSSSTVVLKPMSTTKIPIHVCVVSPGTYDLSSYSVNWTLHLSSNGQVSARDAGSCSSGSGKGEPFYLTVVQKLVDPV